MNQPLHNNAIPQHPAVAAQINEARNNVAPEPAAPEPTPTPPQSDNAQALFDAFDGPKSEPAPIPAPPVAAPQQAVSPQLPSQPQPPVEVPSIEDLLSGGNSPPVPQAQPQPVVQQPVPQVPVQPMQMPQAPDPAALQQQAIDFLMANEYKLSDEDRTRLISAPDEVLPRLAARMHVGIAQQLASQVAQAVPMMIQQHLESHVKAMQAETEFFSKFPKLNKAEWKPVIAESLQMIKQMKPQATREQLMAEGAALAAFRIQSQYGNRYQPPPQQQMQPVQPYVPVAPGGGMSPPINPNQAPNIWTELGSQDWNTW